MNTLFELELEEALETIESEETKERFKIENLDSANWAFRKLAALERKEKEITQLADAEKRRIATWEKEEKAQIQSSKDFFNFLLEEYYRGQRELDPKFKLSTPYGKVTSRKQQAKWNYDDEKVLEWLKENDAELIRVKEEINKAELKKKYQIVGSSVVTEDGEIVEGISIEEREPSISIKVVD